MKPDETLTGYEAGELCNRDGCEGILEKDTCEEGCSCHLHPPCSYCMADVICPECNWSSEDD